MKETIKKTLQTEWFLIKLMFKTDAFSSGIYWFVKTVMYTFPLVSIWLWKLILDELAIIYNKKTANNIIWIYLGIYLTIQILSSFIAEIDLILFEKIKRKVTYDLDVAIMRKMAKIDTAFYDDPKNNIAIYTAQINEGYITSSIGLVVEKIIRIITFISGLIIFLSYDWIIGILFIATYVPGAIISFKHKKKVDQWSMSNIPETREKDYYKSLLTGSFAAKDLRLYNLSDYFKAKYNELWNKIRDERAKLFVKGSIASFLASLLTYSGIVVIILLSVRSVLLGSMAIGTLALYVGLAQTSGKNFGFLIDDIATQVKIVVPHVIHFINFLNYENAIQDNGTQIITGCPSIEFRNVCFYYPGNDNETLHNLNFRIDNGKKIALIGVNGAGKTTVVKLLLRFYEPQSGQILFDGKDIKQYSLKELHNLFGVCFQDINRYSMTLRENIGISDIDRMNDSTAIKDAAEASGADRIAEELESGFETDMTRQFNDKGAELSGGQWQKIALARAFFRNSQFIILDEPSSALDPEAEDYIFSSFKRLCKNKGGILISHRLSSIMMVDEIVLLDNGMVVESGTHTELMKKNGKYAEMYHMQANKYTGSADNE